MSGASLGNCNSLGKIKREKLHRKFEEGKFSIDSFNLTGDWDKEGISSKI